VDLVTNLKSGKSKDRLLQELKGRRIGLQPQFEPIILLAMIALAAWSLFWTSLGLWFSARNGHKNWFIFFMLVHLAGIPEILYLRRHKCWPFGSQP